MLSKALETLTRRGRPRAQGLVEYAAVAAVVTLVGLLGLQALTSAEAAYFKQLPTVGLRPDAPGALLHPTDLTVPTCSPAPIPVTRLLTCQGAVVRDIYDVVADRTAPTGSLAMYLDTNPVSIASCPLTQLRADSSTCVLTWQVPATTAYGDHTLTIAFSCPAGLWPTPPLTPCANRATSNHVGAAVRLTIRVTPYVLLRTPACIPSGGVTWLGRVEVGHPTRCKITAIDGVTNLPAAGVTLIWSIPPPDGTSTGAGIPVLSCATEGVASLIAPVLYATNLQRPCTPGPTQTCTTSAAGTCSIVYRLGRLLSGANVLEPRWQSLDVMTSDSANVAHFANLISVDNSAGPHSTLTWLNCAALTGNVTVDPLTAFQMRNADFFANPHITIRGTSGSLKCTVTVIDESPGAALDCAGTPPNVSCGAFDTDLFDAHSPIGTAALAWQSQLTAPCSLLRDDEKVGPQAPNKVPNQVPYASICTQSVTLVGQPGQPTAQLIAMFQSVGAAPTHTAQAAQPVLVDFIP